MNLSFLVIDIPQSVVAGIQNHRVTTIRRLVLVVNIWLLTVVLVLVNNPSMNIEYETDSDSDTRAITTDYLLYNGAQN